jgi:acyl carrier protein
MSGDDEAILRFLASTFLFELGGEVGPQTNLFRAGLIDSFGFVELVRFLESELGVAVTDEDLMGGRLTSYEGIVDLVRSRRGD